MSEPHLGVMIDHPGTRDRDDAVWVERDGPGWRVFVHIADVASVVRLGSVDDVEACRRAETVYRPDKTIGMLPQAIEQKAALRAGDEVPTCLIEFAVSESGELSEAGVGRGRLAESFELGFHDAADVLADDGHRLHEMMSDTHDLARVLLARRRSMGALAIYDLLHGWATTEEGTIVELAETERNAGYIIVQELMIAANQAAATWAAQRDVAMLFRNHRGGQADRDDLMTWLGHADDEAGLRNARGHMASVLRPAVYEPVAHGHFGLSLPVYTHVTSPLRRYPDLVNQRIVLAVADGGSSPYRPETLDEAAAAVNIRFESRRAKKAQRYRHAAGRSTRSELVGQSYRELDDTAFGKVVRMAVSEGRYSDALADEMLARLDADRLLPRDAVPVLLETTAPLWRPVRERLLGWLTDEPAHALTLLSTYAQQTRTRLRSDERSVGTVTQPMFEAAARLGERSSPPRAAPSKKSARQQAALALVAELCGLPDPSRDIKPETPIAEPRRRVIPAGHPRASAVNELAQAGVLTDLTWEFTSTGSAHEPQHTCTVSAIITERSEMVEATASGATKSAAKAAAAVEFLSVVAPLVP